MVTDFKFGENGFVIRLPGLNEKIKDASELMSRVFDGLWSTMTCTLRSVIVAQVGLIVVKRLGREAKSLSDTVFGFDFGSTDTASGAGTIFRT